MREDSGNVLFLILIAVALFGALAYAVTASTRSGSGSIDAEQAKLDQAVLNNCETAINTALLRLKMLGNCEDDQINYELPDGSNANPNAPADGHCDIFHPEYGGATPCGITTDPSCDLTTLAIGESCGGIVYAGESGGNRIYTTRADHGQTSWNNGTNDPPWTVTGATSTSDGVTNTDTLVALSDAGSPYQAALLCRAQGEEWYLPAQDELNLLYTNRADIGGFNETVAWPEGYYWSSSESGADRAYVQIFGDGTPFTNLKQWTGLSLRCVRRD